MHSGEPMNHDDPMVRAAASDYPAVGLALVRALRTLADRLEDVHVTSARSSGWSWQAIADILQVSRQAVHQKHSHQEAAEAAGRDGHDV